MKANIIFEIECGETTCSSSYGEFCRFFMTVLKDECSCFLFGVLEEVDGRLQRHPYCLVLAKPITPEVIDVEPSGSRSSEE